MEKRYVAYYRVSTKGQGESGLGLEAQRSMVERFCSKDEIIAEFTEIESGTKNKRRILGVAMKEAADNGATLIIANLSRLSRNAGFICMLLDSGVDFICADMPSITPMVMRILGAVAQEEAEAVSRRTKAALAERRSKGLKLGCGRVFTESDRAASKAALKEKAANNPETRKARAYATNLRSQGATLVAICEQLNAAGYKAPMGGEFAPKQVWSMLKVS